MAPTTGTATTAAKAGPGRKKKPEVPTEPTRRSTRTVIPRTIFSAGVSKPKAAPKKRKAMTEEVKEKVAAVAKKAKTAVTKKKPGPKPGAAKKTKAASTKATAKKTKTKTKTKA
ncbi:hypothetical protein TWF730_002423 [Orbilia blumenaviensis]|uniref:Histone H1 n=1 Tax=Orbilia blumenaviensis TaxID=1796055 RepID=A0AAV9UC49_9PEZI